MENKIKVTSGSTGAVWCVGWLFSIGFLGLGFWKGLLALIVWPYFLGVYLAGIVG